MNLASHGLYVLLLRHLKLMTEKVKKKTKATPKNETTEHPPQDASTNWHLAPPRNFPFTFCYVLGAIIVSIGTGIGLTSTHSTIAIIICIVGFIVCIVGGVVHFRAERGSKQKPLNRQAIRAVSIPILKVVAVWLALYILIKIVTYISAEQYRIAHIPPTPTNKTEVLPDGRILLVDMTPEYLRFLFRDRTNVEALNLLEPYWDKWIIIEGTVNDLRNHFYKTSSTSFLYIDRPEPFGIQGTEFEDAKQIERIQPLIKGNPVKVLCKITKDSTDFTLEQCELL